jgi:two-component system alkaline phosphatase synthesis response regulator PhoP
MLTARVEDQDKVVGLELGADDYVTKPFNPREVVARVRAVLRRTQAGPVRPHVIQAGPLMIDLDKHLVEADQRPLHLTPTEFELLRVLAEHPDRALTRSELIELALGYQYEGLERTVDSHIKNLRHKLSEAGVSSGWLETEFGVGYRWRSVLDVPSGGAS